MNLEWHKLVKTLLSYYSDPNWWPGESVFEVAVSAVLTQNTNWRNVEKALDNLKSAGIGSWDALLQADGLEELIKPAGFAKRKALTLKALSELMLSRKEPTRTELMAIKGIGPETADSILLYALDKPEMVVDAYTYRVLTRCGLYEGRFDYEDIKRLLTTYTDGSTTFMKALHAAFVELGKAHCTKTPRCSGCPLSSLRAKQKRGASSSP
ncbi:endonuclease III [Coprothermobacteraceae bacterium]|nr:endonuclease III [Coprothermobacteraceae bacterium]